MTATPTTVKERPQSSNIRETSSSDIEFWSRLHRVEVLLVQAREMMKEIKEGSA